MDGDLSRRCEVAGRVRCAAGLGHQVGRDGRALGVRLVAVREDRVGDAPVGADRGVVPRHAELVGRVVVAVDEVGDRHVGERGEAVGDAGRDETPRWSCVPSACSPRSSVSVAPSVGEPSRRSCSTTRAAPERHVPVVGLVQVVVQPDEAAGRAVAPVALDHLPPGGEPLAPVGLDEEAALVAEDLRARRGRRRRSSATR